MKLNVPVGGFSTELNASWVSLAYHSITADHGLSLMANVISFGFGAGAGVFGSALGSSALTESIGLAGGVSGWPQTVPPTRPVARAAPANERSHRFGQRYFRGVFMSGTPPSGPRPIPRDRART